jgi:hypothetical protein
MCQAKNMRRLDSCNRTCRKVCKQGSMVYSRSSNSQRIAAFNTVQRCMRETVRRP